MGAQQRTGPDGSSILIRRLDGHLAILRVHPGHPDVAVAEQVAGSLREMVVSTAAASAADRARVRAAVNYFVMRRRRLARSLIGDGRVVSGDLRVVNETARRLGREDLVVNPAWRPG